MSLRRPPFCNLRVSPSSELLHNQMWLYRFHHSYYYMNRMLMSPHKYVLFLAGRPQFESVHHQNRRLSSHSYSHESVIFFVFLGLIFFKLRRVCVFFSITARGYVQPLTTEHCGSVHYITIGDSRLLKAAGLTRSPFYLIGDAASRCGLSRVGYFIPLNGRRPLNGHPPSISLRTKPYQSHFLQILVSLQHSSYILVNYLYFSSKNIIARRTE